MTKIRDNLTKAFAVFAVFFIVYIVLDWGMDITGRKGRGLTGGDHIGTVARRTDVHHDILAFAFRKILGLRQGKSEQRNEQKETKHMSHYIYKNLARHDSRVAGIEPANGGRS